MQNKFINRLQKIDNYQEKKYLIAISGGLDSIVISYLFYISGLNFELAHCNFKLRGKESDDDQNFVEKFAKKYNIPLHIKICDAKKNKEKNTQIAARNLRYEWFDQLKEKNNFDFIVTAHHLNDSIETFFINLQRSTGLKGLLGIPENQKHIRPLLDFTRNEIEKFAKENSLDWREDSSNASNKYLRNKIRHQIIPKFIEINPSFEKSMKQTMDLLSSSNDIIKDWYQAKYDELIQMENDYYVLSLTKLKKIKHQNQFLYYWLSEYGFTDWTAIYDLPNSQTGKFVQNDKYQLTKHGNKLILNQKQEQNNKKHYQINQLDDFNLLPFGIKYVLNDTNDIDINQIKKAIKNETYLDFDKLKFPLTIRKWQAGDYFYPLGMKGKKKKLSDFFKDEKISLPEKENIWILTDNKNIVWVVGKRTDNRYRITENTKKILKITF